MKKIISVLLVIIVGSLSVSCGKSMTTEPSISQMRSICELATMECYYHNVAKYNKEDATGALWWKKDRHFWVEYSGVVSVGIDASLVTMEITNDVVTITIPPAKVLGCKVDDLTPDSFIVAKGAAKVEAEHQIEAFKDAQLKMELTAKADTAMLASAQERAKLLLEDYVNNIGELLDKEYQIKWVDVEDRAIQEVNAEEAQ